MRTAPKVTLIIGALMLVGSIVAVVVGIGSTDFEDMVEQEVFTGEAPTNWDAELQWSSIYFVYVEEGSNVSAEILEGDVNNRFIPCSEDFSCQDYNTRLGYTYIGDLSVQNDGLYQVGFSGDGDVLVTETEVDIDGILTAGFGIWCGCCSFIVLIIGLIMALVMKDNLPTQVVVMPHGAGQVSFAAQPASYVPGQPVVMNQEVSYQPPLQSDQPWQPPNSGV